MKSRIVAAGIVLGLVMTVALGKDAPGKEAESGDLDKQAALIATKGLDWLKSQQNENGSWSNTNFPALTALGLWAFSRSDHPDKKEICEKAVNFILQFVQEDGSIYKPATHGRRSGGLSVYNTAICMTALHSYNERKYAKQILKAREFMASSQLTGDSQGTGGFGYSSPASRKRKQRGDLSNTTWVMLAMRETESVEDLRPANEKKADIDWDASLDFLKKLQNNDQKDEDHFGGFGYEGGGGRGGFFKKKDDDTISLRTYGSMTYAGLEALIYARVDQNDARVMSAREWASKHWSVKENPGMGDKGIFYYYNIMAKSLSLFGNGVLKGDKGKIIKWKQDLVDQLAEVQNKDGSWVNDNGALWESDAVLVTSYSLLALESAMGK